MSISGVCSRRRVTLSVAEVAFVISGAKEKNCPAPWAATVIDMTQTKNWTTEYSPSRSKVLPYQNSNAYSLVTSRARRVH